jgi:hypothetical protein
VTFFRPGALAFFFSSLFKKYLRASSQGSAKSRESAIEGIGSRNASTAQVRQRRGKQETYADVSTYKGVEWNTNMRVPLF